MSRRLVVGGLGLTTIAAVLVGVSLASASSSTGQTRVWGAPRAMVHIAPALPASTGDATLTVISRHERETDVDEPPTGFSQGDEVTIGSPLFNTAGSHVGHLDVHGAITIIRQRAGIARGQFEFTATLPGGSITATGVATFNESAESPGFTAGVTGGTGAYQQTDGWVRVIFSNGDGTTFVYHLTD